MFKLAIICTLATSAVNALEVEADTEQRFRNRWAAPGADFGGGFPRSPNIVKRRNIAPIGNIGGIKFSDRKGRRPGPRVTLDEENRPTLQGEPRRGYSGPSTTSSAKESAVRQRLDDYKPGRGFRYGGGRGRHGTLKGARPRPKFALKALEAARPPLDF